MKRKLPTGEAAVALVERWRRADVAEKTRMAEELGVARGTLANFCSYIRSPLAPSRPEPAPSKSGEAQVLLVGDMHDGEITESFNHDVCRARLGELYRRTMAITKLHRNLYPITSLDIQFLGDMVHGENPHQGAKLESAHCGAMSQVYDLALPLIHDLILDFREEFDTIRVRGVPGNHGRVAKEAPETSNWDLMLYQALAAKRWPDGITVQPSRDFCQIADIQGHRFFFFHGDQIRMSNGIPWFALSRKVLSWYITYGGFEYAACGHFHRDDFLRISAMTKLFVNGSFVSDDPYALKVMGTSSIPSQWTFGVHPRRGVTWAYSLVLDDQYLPGHVPVRMA